MDKNDYASKYKDKSLTIATIRPSMLRWATKNTMDHKEHKALLRNKCRTLEN